MFTIKDLKTLIVDADDDLPVEVVGRYCHQDDMVMTDLGLDENGLWFELGYECDAAGFLQNRDKVTIDEIIGIVKCEPTNSVELKKENTKLILENTKLKAENTMLKATIGRNEAYIARLKGQSSWRI